MARSLWQQWLRFGKALGNVLGRIELTVFYFTIVVPFGIIARLFTDPLAVRSKAPATWIERETKDWTLRDGKRQF